VTVVSLTGFRPLRRFDEVPWERARIEESATGIDGSWASRGVQNLVPVDTDPAQPAIRDFTVTNAVLAAGFYRVVFLDEEDNESPSPAIYSGPSALDGYPSTGSLLSDSSEDALLDLDGSDQDRLRIAAINAVEEYTGQRFVPEPLTRTLDGSGSGVLRLDRRLAELDTLVVERSGLTESDVLLSEDKTRLHIRAELGALNYYEKVMIDFADSRPLFTYGVGTVEIAGTWGWASDEFPEAVGEAIRVDMEDKALASSHQLHNNIRAYEALGLREIQQGELRLRRDPVQQATLSERAQGLLLGLIWQPGGGVMV
jgi:hypothetical protein